MKVNKNIVLKPTSKTSLRFKGHLIATGESSMKTSHHCYSGLPGRKDLINIYQTDQSEFIVEIRRETIYVGEENNVRVIECPTEDEVKHILAKINPIVRDDLLKQADLNKADHSNEVISLGYKSG